MLSESSLHDLALEIKREYSHIEKATVEAPQK